jgi:hypothetical protein
MNHTYCRHRTVYYFFDNISLVYLWGVSMTPREKRMASYIKEFALEFQCENILTDAISRSYEDMAPSEREVWIHQTDPRDDFFLRSRLMTKFAHICAGVFLDP